jgi:hypothetical protein
MRRHLRANNLDKPEICIPDFDFAVDIGGWRIYNRVFEHTTPMVMGQHDWGGFPL